MVAAVAFTLLPALDVSGGRVVRGEASDPVAAALEVQRAGVEWLHLVDLDAAYGRGANVDVLDAVIGALDIQVELAGGIHSEAALDWALDTGSERIVLAADALIDRAWCSRVVAEHGSRIAVSLDVRIESGANGQRSHVIAPRGAGEELSTDRRDMWQTIEWLESLNCAQYIVTDVTRDGAMTGPNVELCHLIDAQTSASVIASGGVSSLADLVAVQAAGLDGCIVGSAFWTGALDMSDALAAVRTER